ncbi:MAG TPA: transporter [Gemmatimonadales bacterium]|nr:transporter [Gemmatimonadales bacterium]
MPPFRAIRFIARSAPLLLLVAGLPSGVSAQAAPRTDTPQGGKFRLTFEPVITTWDYEFTPQGRLPIGASLPATVFIRQEQRVTPLQVEYGITNRIAVGLKMPLVRVNSRQSYNVDTNGVVDSAGKALDSLLNDTTYAYGSLSPTPRHLHYFAGDFEVQAKYRFLESANFAMSGTFLWRLPTGHQDSPNNLFDIPTGDHQTDIEIQLAQELTLFRRLWLNLSLRAATQRPGTRDMRIGPQSELLIPHAALAKLNWDPGDYVAIDIAPMYRFSKFFGAGFTAGYYAKQTDHYSYRSAQDSIDVTTHMGGTPLAASILDPGTAVRRWRLGAAMTYMAPDVEGSLSIEQTVKAPLGERVPAASVFRIVMRLSRWPF